MNKKLLSLAVAAALTSSSALALVDLNATAPATVSIATENTIATTGTAIVNAGNALDVVVNAGFSISDTTSRFMRFDFVGTSFTVPVVAGDLVVDDSGANATIVLSTGGAAAGTSVVFEVTASSGNIVGVANDATLAIPNYTFAAETSATVTYRLYDNAVDAVNNTTTSALVTTSGTLASFAAGNTTAATAVTPEAIDVTQGATFFAGGTGDVLTFVGSMTTSNTTGTQVSIDGATDVTKAVSEVSSTLTVTGDFSFTQDLTAGVPDGTYTAGSVVYATNADCTTGSTAATSVTATTVVLNTTAVAAGTQIWICPTANGVSVIGEGTYTGVYAAVANTNYDAESTSLTLGTLAKNGSSVSQHLALTPGGAYSNFIRIVNTSNNIGDVSMTVYSDTGSNANIDLSDIAGQTTSALVGQASTSLIAIQDIYDAAVAADATFAHNGGKLRLVIDGEFGSIEAQSITLSTDNTSFSTF